MIFNPTAITAFFTAASVAVNSVQAASLRGRGKDIGSFAQRNLDDTNPWDGFSIDNLCDQPNVYEDVSTVQAFNQGVSRVCVVNDSTMPLAWELMAGTGANWSILYHSPVTESAPGPHTDPNPGWIGGAGPYQGVDQNSMDCFNVATNTDLFRGTDLSMQISVAEEVDLPCGSLMPGMAYPFPIYVAGGCVNGEGGCRYATFMDGALQYNPNSSATAVIQCVDTLDAPYIKCGASNAVLMSDYEGSWEYRGGMGSVSWTAGYTWSHSETDTYSHSFEYGFSQELQMKSGVPPFGTVTMTAGATQQVNNTSTQSITQANQESGSYTCANSDKVSNCDGSIFQWQVSANSYSTTGSKDTAVSVCSFVCVPSELSGTTEPKCPDRFCASRLDGCQCCNAIWRSDDDTPEGNYLSYQNGGTCGTPPTESPTNSPTETPTLSPTTATPTSSPTEAPTMNTCDQNSTGNTCNSSPGCTWNAGKCGPVSN